MQRDIGELAEAIAGQRKGDAWQTVTVVTPTNISALQTRRQLVRRGGSLANIHWVTPETLLRTVGWPSRIRISGEIWRAIQAPFAEWFEFGDPLEILRSARDAITRLRDEDSLPADTDSRLQAAFAELENRLPTWRHENSHAKGEAIPFRTEKEEKCEHSSISVTIAHDAFEEVHLALEAIRQSILIGTPACRIGLVVPDNWYAGLATDLAVQSGVLTNGFPQTPTAITKGGRILMAQNWHHESWTEAIASAKEALREEPDLAIRQPLLDRIEDWSQLADAGIDYAIPLAQLLADDIVRGRIPGDNKFGDGIFVGRLEEFEGLDFDELFVLGFTDHNYPRVESTNLLIPRSLQTKGGHEQERAFDTLASRCQKVSVYIPRGDRRNGAVAFPSSWIASRASGEVREIASRTERHQAIPILTRADQAIADRVGRLPASQAEIRYARSKGNIASEGLVRIDPKEILAPLRGWSASALETYLTCPRRYFYQSVAKIPEIRSNVFGIPSDVRGQIAHRVLNNLFTEYHGDLKNPQFAWHLEHLEEARQAVLADADKEDQTLPAQRRDAYQLADELTAFLRVDSEDRANHNWVPIATESKFETQVNGIPTRGTIDRIDIGPGGVHRIIDYKTGFVRPWKVDQPTDGGRRIQWLLYSEAVLIQKPALDYAQATYWSLRDGQKHDLSYGVEQREVLFDWLESARDMASEGLIPVRPQTTVCAHCPYTSICPSDRNAVKLQQIKEADGAYRRYLELTEPADGEGESDGSEG